MADMERPKRLRGAKQAEEFYRAGFLDGLQHGSTEAHEKRAIDAKRDDAVRQGLERLRDRVATRPKRRHRKTVEVDTRTDDQKLRDLAQERSNGV